MPHSVHKIKKSTDFQSDPRKTERINGKIYAMASPNVHHGDLNLRVTNIIYNSLKGSPSKVYMANLDLVYHPFHKSEKKRDDYLTPDIMIVCDKEKIAGGQYYGVPKFIVETFSPSTAKKDRTIKMKIYESLGVAEYWLANPKGTLEIYYLKSGKYKLHQSLAICDDKKDADYNANLAITLRCFPKVKMVLGDIFE